MSNKHITEYRNNHEHKKDIAFKNETGGEKNFLEIGGGETVLL